MKAEGGQSVFQTREERDSSELGGSGGGYGFSARIPLKECRRVCTFFASRRSRASADRQTVSRETIVNDDRRAPEARPAEAAAGRRRARARCWCACRTRTHRRPGETRGDPPTHLSHPPHLSQ